MKPGFLRVSFLRLCMTIIGLFGSVQVNAEQVGGWIERALLPAHGLLMHAKLDSGAETCSLNAQDMQLYMHDGQQHVRFAVTDRDGNVATIDQPVVRWSRIKRHFTAPQERPVIELSICIGNVSQQVEVNLVDRKKLKYQLLIGRNFLADTTFIDSGRTYLLQADCAEPAKQ